MTLSVVPEPSKTGSSVSTIKKGRKRIAGQTEMLLPIAGKKGKQRAVARPTAKRQKKAG